MAQSKMLKLAMIPGVLIDELAVKPSGFKAFVLQVKQLPIPSVYPGRCLGLAP